MGHLMYKWMVATGMYTQMLRDGPMWYTVVPHLIRAPASVPTCDFASTVISHLLPSRKLTSIILYSSLPLSYCQIIQSPSTLSPIIYLAATGLLGGCGPRCCRGRGVVREWLVAQLTCSPGLSWVDTHISRDTRLPVSPPLPGLPIKVYPLLLKLANQYTPANILLQSCKCVRLMYVHVGMRCLRLGWRLQGECFPHSPPATYPCGQESSPGPQLSYSLKLK